MQFEVTDRELFERRTTRFPCMPLICCISKKGNALKADVDENVAY